VAHSIVFCGTPDFAVPSLKALLDDPAFTVELVITQPDKKVGRKQELTPPPVKVLAEERGVPVAQPENIAAFQFLAPRFQFLVVVAYGQILPQTVLDLPAIAPVNVHASLLPRWRGASPIQHAILAGDPQTGVTIQRMVRELDAGPILAQAAQPLAPDTTAAMLHEELAKLGAALLIETLKKPLDPKPQNESDVTVCRKLTRQDGVCDPAAMTAADIDRRVRALTPWPGVTCEVSGQTVKIHAASLQPREKSVALPCKDGTTLWILGLQSPGKRAMTAEEWLRGR
jgi:methionyl-tRNA formyltransferase